MIKERKIPGGVEEVYLHIWVFAFVSQLTREIAPFFKELIQVCAQWGILQFFPSSLNEVFSVPDAYFIMIFENMLV